MSFSVKLFLALFQSQTSFLGNYFPGDSRRTNHSCKEFFEKRLTIKITFISRKQTFINNFLHNHSLARLVEAAFEILFGFSICSS